MRRSIYMAAFAALSAWAAASAAERVLPIREQALLEATIAARLPSIARYVNVSPDGARVAYVEVDYRPPNKVGYGREFSHDAHWSFWVGAANGGKRVRLGGDESSVEPFLIDKQFEPRWSADGRHIALLKQQADADAVLVYPTDGAGPVERFDLPTLYPQEARGKVVDWSWDSARSEVTLGLEPPAPAMPSIPKWAEETERWTWIYSRDLARWSDSIPALEHRLVIVNLATHALRDVTPHSDAFRLERAYAEHMYEPIPADVNWRLSADGREVLANVRDARVESFGDSKLMGLLRTGDPQAKSFADARNSVEQIDVATGAARRVYEGGPGRVSRQILARDGSGVVVVQSEPSLATWPMFSQWGRIHWTQRGTNDVALSRKPVPLDAMLFAADRADAIYVFDPNLLQLYEMQRSDGVLKPLTPPGLSVTRCSVSADGRTIAAVVEGTDYPGRVQVWTSRKRKWHTVGPNPKSWRAPGRLPIEPVQWRSKDDLYDVDGFVAKPVDFDARRKYPLLVLMKGGNAEGTVRFENRFDPFFGGGEVGGPPVSIYTAAGYVVLMPNHRVSRFTPVRAAQALIGHYGEHVALDVESGIDALIARGFVDAERIGIYGQSHGGDEVAYAISHSRRFKAAVVNDSPILMPDEFAPMVDVGLPTLVPWYGREVMSHLVGFDVTRKLWVDPTEIRTPLLMRWSAFVRPGRPARPLGLAEGWSMLGFAGGPQVVRVLDALQHNNVPADVLVDRDEHQVEQVSYMLEWQSRLLQWFDFYVRGAGENPLPAMQSPIDYTQMLKEALANGADTPPAADAPPPPSAESKDESATSSQPGVRPLSLTDALSRNGFMPNGSGAAFSPDSSQLAYVLCDPKRRAAASREGVNAIAATRDAAMYSLGCEVWVSAASGGSPRKISGEVGNSWSPAWSPDGKSILFVSDRDGAPKLWLWESHTQTLRKFSDEPVRSRSGAERPQWLPDGSGVLVRLRPPGMPDAELEDQSLRVETKPKAQLDANGSTVVVYESRPQNLSHAADAPPANAPRPPKDFIGDLALVSADTGRARRLVERVSALHVELSPDGRSFLYLKWKAPSEFGMAVRAHELVVVDIASGRSHIAVPELQLFSARSVAWSPDSRWIAYFSTTRAAQLVNREVGRGSLSHGDLFAVSAAGGAPMHFVPTQAVVGFDTDYQRPLWSPDSKAVYAIAANKVWRGDLVERRVAPLGGSDALELRLLVDRGDRSTVWTPQGAAAVVVTRDVRTKQAGFHAIAADGSLTTLLQENKRYAGDYSALASPDGRRLVYQAESASEPEDLWTLTVSSRKPVRVTRANPQLERYEFGRAQLIDFRSADGKPLQAGLLLPAGYERGKRYPTLVLVYAGDPASRSVYTFGLVPYGQYNYQMFATRGYAVLFPDIPVNVGTPMQDLMKAVMPAIDAAVGLGVVDPDRLGVTGQSNGGYSTLAMIAQTHRFKAAVMNAGFGDLTAMFGMMDLRNGEGSWHPWLLDLGGGMGVPPWENPTRYVENSPLYFLDRIDTPLIIQAGGLDSSIVPLSDEVYVGMKKLGKDVTYLRYPDESHLIENPANQRDYWNRVLPFWDAHLKAR